MKRSLGIAMVATSIGLLAVAPTGTATASPPQPSNYVVASIPVDEGAGFPVLFTHLDGRLCLPPLPPLIGLCSDLPSLLFSPIASSGTIWTDASSPNFGLIVNELTNGTLGGFGWEITHPGCCGGLANNDGEAVLLGDQVGPSGVDLAGYTVERIGFRVDSVTFDSPGEDGNGDGIWTDFRLRGAFVFEGRIASMQACMAGGWQHLHGPEGSSFSNQGQCIRLVAAGK
jgi:hypothetical protein